MLLDDLERPVEELLAAGMPLDLPAGGLRNAVRSDEHDRLDGHLVFAGERGADRLEGGVDRPSLPSAPLQFRDHHHAFAPLDVHGECRHRTRPHEVARRLDGVLDVLGIVVASADDDQVLEPARDEELSVVEEPEVARPEVRTVVGSPLGHAVSGGRLGRLHQHGAKRLAGGVRAVPVPLRDARTAHPDLADPARSQRLARLGIDDEHVLAVEFAAAAHEQPRAGCVDRPALRRAGLDRPGVERPDDRLLELHAACHHERALGEAVARVEGLATEATHREGLAEGLDRLGPHRLGAVEGKRPARQVELGPLFGRGLPHAELIGEVRPATDRRAVAGDRLQPPQGPLQERDGRHQHVELAAVQRDEDAADEPHVVEARQPEDARLAPRDLEGLHDPQRVVQQVFVRQHHALGRAGGAARVLQEREGVAIDLGALPAIRPVGLELGVDLPDEVLEARRGGLQTVEAVEHVAGREGDGGVRIRGDRLDPLH